MAGLLDELVDTMSKENDIYKELIPIASEKTRVIIHNDLNALQEITDREQRVIERVNSLEHKRTEVIKNMGVVLSRDPAALTMKTLIKLMASHPEEQRRLTKVHDELSSTLQRLVRLNDKNQQLIKQSLEMIDFNLNLIQSTRMAPGVNTYTSRGACGDMMSSAATRMFDARQ